MRFEGGNNMWNGVLYAPKGSIHSERDPAETVTRFNGGLVAYVVDLSSPGFDITSDPSLGAPPKVRLFR
jgi:hypothetical protein